MTLAATEFPRLLAGLPASGPIGLRAHVALHGPLPHLRRRSARAEHPLILELERAGLRGYGGAGFPTATKLQAVAAQRSRPAVVVNASEGEPLSGKDALLMRQLPHLVIDGALTVAEMLGSNTVVLAVDEYAAATTGAAESAVAERLELRQRRAPDVSVAWVPRGYLTGQETALINVLDGGAAKPTLTPPYPFERGLRGRPTLVSNAETFAQIALVARHGADWWRALGSEAAPGTRLVTVAGGVANPDVVEIAGGTSLRQLFDVSGGLLEPLQGVLLGGYAGTWLGPEDVDLRLGESGGRGVRLGAGIAFALPESACIVAEVAHAVRWLQSQSAGQCGPCVHGLRAIADALDDLREQGDRRGAYRHVERWCGLVTRRGACALPDGTAVFVTSALRRFRPEFEDHARHGGCDACFERRQLPAPQTSVLA